MDDSKLILEEEDYSKNQFSTYAVVDNGNDISFQVGTNIVSFPKKLITDDMVNFLKERRNFRWRKEWYDVRQQ